MRQRGYSNANRLLIALGLQLVRLVLYYRLWPPITRRSTRSTRYTPSPHTTRRHLQYDTTAYTLPAPGVARALGGSSPSARPGLGLNFSKPALVINQGHTKRAEFHVGHAGTCRSRKLPGALLEYTMITPYTTCESDGSRQTQTNANLMSATLLVGDNVGYCFL